jgi:hypothetical protein
VAAPLDPARARLAPWFPLVTAATGGALLLSALAHLRQAANAGTAGATTTPGATGGTTSQLVAVSLLGAAVGAALCLVALWARRRRPPEQLMHAVLAAALVATGLDALAVTLVTGSLERTVDAALAIVAAGGLLPDRRWSLTVVATLATAWVVVASRAGDSRPYLLGALLVATALSAATRERCRPAARRRVQDDMSTR